MTEIFTILFEDCDMYRVEVVKSFTSLGKAKKYLTEYCFNSDMEMLLDDEQGLFETLWEMKHGKGEDEESDSETDSDEENSNKWKGTKEDCEQLEKDEELMRKEVRKCMKSKKYYEKNYKEKLMEYKRNDIENGFKIPEKDTLSSDKKLLTIFHGVGHYTIISNSLE